MDKKTICKIIDQIDGIALVKIAEKHNIPVGKTPEKTKQNIKEHWKRLNLIAVFFQIDNEEYFRVRLKKEDG